MANGLQHAMSKVKSKRVAEGKIVKLPFGWPAISVQVFHLCIFHCKSCMAQRWMGNVRKLARPNRNVSHQNLSIFHTVKQFSAVMICRGYRGNCGSMGAQMKSCSEPFKQSDVELIYHVIYGKLIKCIRWLKFSRKTRKIGFRMETNP